MDYSLAVSHGKSGEGKKYFSLKRTHMLLPSVMVYGRALRLWRLRRKRGLSYKYHHGQDKIEFWARNVQQMRVSRRQQRGPKWFHGASASDNTNISKLLSLTNAGVALFGGWFLLVRQIEFSTKMSKK